MAIYRFKVSFEDEEVYRVIELRSIHTFKDFHQAIQSAVGFDNSKEASFYMSDDYWRKGTEITLHDDTAAVADLQRKPKRLMHKSKMAEFIEDPHQKMLYLFDFDNQWNFTIELVKIIVDEDATASYPRTVKSNGIAPKQYKPTLLPPVAEDEDDEEPEPTKEKIFQHEEALGEGDDEALEGEEGEAAEEESEEGAEEETADSGDGHEGADVEEP